MIKKISAAAVFAAALLSLGAAQAQEFYATPLNPGPPTLGAAGNMIPGANIALGIVNGVTQPILQPMLVPASTGPMEAPMMMRHHHHHHHHMARMKMKHKMS